MDSDETRDRPAETPDDVVLLKDIEVPARFYIRHLFGVQVIDEIFGGTDTPGIMPGTSYLFTGSPGAGKSTMCLQLADALHKNAGLNVLYNIGEESLFMTKLRANRIGLQQEYCVAEVQSAERLVEVVQETGVEVLFQDSLQSISYKDFKGPRLEVELVKYFRDFSKAEGVTVFLVGHVTKAGRFAGRNEIEHDVDAHAHLRFNPDTGNRVFEMIKNRNGPARIPYEFVLSANGLDFQQVTQGESVAPSGSSRAYDRRARIVTLIKEKLLGGELISGYCFERFQVDCSGGFWRAMLAKACHELVQAGHKVLEERVNGRAHAYIEEAIVGSVPFEVDTPTPTGESGDG